MNPKGNSIGQQQMMNPMTNVMDQKQNMINPMMNQMNSMNQAQNMVNQMMMNTMVG